MNRTFFVTSVTAQRRTLFQTDATADLFIETLLHYRNQKKYLLHEFVVMPDHFHALITPDERVSLEKAVQFIKGGFSFRLKPKLPVWQASFTNHRIRDEEDFAKHREYIRMNPVRARLVRRAEEYRHSSASGKFVLDPVPPGLKPDLNNRLNAALKRRFSTKIHRPSLSARASLLPPDSHSTPCQAPF